MKKIIIGFVCIIIFMGVIFTIKSGYSLYENRYQQDADAKRIYDMHKLVMIIEEYKTKTGRYPLEDFSLNSSEPLSKKSRINVIITHNDFDDVAKEFRITRPRFTYDLYKNNGHTALVSKPEDHIFLSSDILTHDIKKIMGKDVKIPYDPQKVPSGRPNFYQYVIYNGNYVISAVLYNEYEGAEKVAEHYYKYEFGNNNFFGDYVKQFRNVSDEEKKRVEKQGLEITKRLSSHTIVESF